VEFELILPGMQALICCGSVTIKREEEIHCVPGHNRRESD